MEAMLQAFAPFGLQGLIIAWLLWERRQERKEQAELDKETNNVLRGLTSTLTGVHTLISAKKGV